MIALDDTIVAIASDQGGAARGIVRLSGPQSLVAIAAIAEGTPPLPQRAPAFPTVLPCTLALQTEADPARRAALSAECYLWPQGRSYTGQCCAELHTIGAPPLLQAIVERLIGQGVRLARPGEFTLRAFLAGRLDLTQAEAVLGVIEAADDRALSAALAQLAGGVAAPFSRLRGELAELLAEVEAGLDFADEDVRFLTQRELAARIDDAKAKIAGLAAQCRGRASGERWPQVVLVGRPNAGKSSLFNALVGDSRAITADAPGTTRDALCAQVDFHGVRCELIDTAGRETRVPAEPRTDATTDLADSDEPHSPDAAAAFVAQEASDRADVRLICVDAVEEGLPRGGVPCAADPRRDLLLWTKCDRAPAMRPGNVDRAAATAAAPFPFPYASPPPGAALIESIATSARTGEGLDALRAAVRRRLATLEAGPAEIMPGTALRAVDSLAGAHGALERAGRLVAEGAWEEIVAAELRAALDELGKVTGEVYTEDILDRIFSRFCIGK